MDVEAAGLRLGLQNAERWKASFDASAKARKFDQFNFVAVRFSNVLAVVASGGFHPEYDFKGQPVQKLGTVENDLDHMLFNLTVLDGASGAVFGWVENTLGPAEAFARSFVELPPEEQANAAIRLAFKHLENTYIKPSWWIR
jgi:hypothetical protein